MKSTILIPMPPKHAKRAKWFRKAVEEVKKRMKDSMDLISALYLNDNCKIWKELRQKKCTRNFPF